MVHRAQHRSDHSDVDNTHGALGDSRLANLRVTKIAAEERDKITSRDFGLVEVNSRHRGTAFDNGAQHSASYETRTA